MRLFYLTVLPIFGILFIISSLAQAIPNNTGLASLSIATPATRLWNLQDADILSIIHEISQATGKNFVVDPRVNGKITLISSKPIAENQVYAVFLSILSALGYSAVPGEGIIKIVPTPDSSEMTTRLATTKAPGKGDEIVVRVIPLENISASQVISSIRPLLPQWSTISAYIPGNVLILTGQASNLQRIVRLIQEVDHTTNNNIEVIPLHHASAMQVSTVLVNLQNAGHMSNEMPAATIAVDERSNYIILSGTQAARLKMRLLILQLDQPTHTNSGSTEVVYLRYLKAKEIAPLLNQVVVNIMGEKQSIASPPLPTENQDHKNWANLTTTPIQAELTTNALIITAPTTIMKALKSIISRLDIRPAQVLIEAVIAEIDERDLKNLGIQWGSFIKPKNLLPTIDGILPTDFPIPGAGSLGIIPDMSIRAVLNLLENINGANILSTPSIVVLDNHKATIEVGQDVPQQSGSFSTPPTTGGQISPFNTFDRRRVSLQLDVIPQINLGNAVRLSIALRNDTLRNPDNPSSNPLINVSQIKNAVIVNNNNILVLGGLISNYYHETINKVPILSDLPLLGLAFQQKSRSLEKKTLIVFIKPIILHHAEEALIITHTKYEAIRQIQIHAAQQFKNIDKDMISNILPAWEAINVLPGSVNTTLRASK